MAKRPPLTEEQRARRKAQRRTAAALRRGESPLGGEFASYVRTARDEQFSAGSGDDDEIPLSYDPTKTTWPSNGWDHRRTTAAGYNRETETLRVQFFTNGAIYDYWPVSPAEAKAFKRAPSPGIYINQILNAKNYQRVD